MTTEKGISITAYLANIRDTDDKVLGVVTDKYQVVQNHEALAFTEELLGHGVRYKTAGMLQEGRKTWILAKMPQRYQMSGDWIEPYLIFYNTHDGSGSLKVALTPSVSPARTPSISHCAGQKVAGPPNTPGTSASNWKMQGKPSFEPNSTFHQRTHRPAKKCNKNTGKKHRKTQG